MTKEDFTALGIASEAAEKLSEKFSELERENMGLREAVSEKEKSLKENEAAIAEAESLKRQLERLKEEAEQAKSAYGAELNALRVGSAVEKALIRAGARNLKAVGSLIDREQIAVDEKGGLTGLEQQLEALKQSDPYLFKESEQANSSAPFGEIMTFAPEEGIDEGADGVDFSQMTYSQITDYLAENSN